MMLSFRFTADWIQGQPRDASDGEVVGSTTRPVSLSLMFVPPAQHMPSMAAASAAASSSPDPPSELRLFEMNVFSTKTPMQPQSSRGEVAVSKSALYERVTPSTTSSSSSPAPHTHSSSSRWSEIYHSCVIKKNSQITQHYKCEHISFRW
jgi:hypothetical protein